MTDPQVPNTPRNTRLPRIILGCTLVVALALGILVFVNGRSWMNGSPQTPIASVPGDTPKDTPKPMIGGLELFSTWPKDTKPDVAIVLTGQTHGYLQPCGCSRPQYGGLERRANLIKLLKDKGWPVTALDLGDITEPKPAGRKHVMDTTYLKYTYTMKAYQAMGYGAFGVGEKDFAADFWQVFGRYLNVRDEKGTLPMLAGNIATDVDRDMKGEFTKFTPREKAFFAGEGKRPYVDVVEVLATSETVPVGVVSVVGPTIAKDIEKIDKTFGFMSNKSILTAAVKQLAGSKPKPEVNILLYQGTPAEAEEVAKDFGEFQAILCQSEASDPPAFPTKVKNKSGTETLILQVGHKGKNVGVLGVFKTKDGINLHYQLVQLGEEYLTANNAEAEKNNKVLQLLEEFASKMKEDDLMAKYVKDRPMHAMQIIHKGKELKYVGSDACMKCHAAEYKVWSATKHAKAYDALEKIAKRPSNQQFNAECLQCHTTGFEYETGFENAKKSAHLMHNGCENCHGPGSLHAADPKDKTYIKDMLPWRPKVEDKLPPKAHFEKMAKLPPIERGKVEVPAKDKRNISLVAAMCTKCHDSENDPKFDFEEYFPKIHHSGLKSSGLPEGVGK